MNRPLRANGGGALGWSWCCSDLRAQHSSAQLRSPANLLTLSAALSLPPALFIPLFVGHSSLFPLVSSLPAALLAWAHGRQPHKERIRQAQGRRPRGRGESPTPPTVSPRDEKGLATRTGPRFPPKCLVHRWAVDGGGGLAGIEFPCCLYKPKQPLVLSLSNLVPVLLRACLEVASAHSPSLGLSVPICAMRGARLGQVQGSFNSDCVTQQVSPSQPSLPERPCGFLS